RSQSVLTAYRTSPSTHDDLIMSISVSIFLLRRYWAYWLSVISNSDLVTLHSTGSINSPPLPFSAPDITPVKMTRDESGSASAAAWDTTPLDSCQLSNTTIIVRNIRNASY